MWMLKVRNEDVDKYGMSVEKAKQIVARGRRYYGPSIIRDAERTIARAAKQGE